MLRKPDVSRVVDDREDQIIYKHMEKKTRSTLKEQYVVPAQDRRRVLHPAVRRGSQKPQFHPDWSPFPAWKTR